MSTVELLTNQNVAALPTWKAPVAYARLRRVRAIAVGTMLALLDASVALVAFLAAYWVRFILPAEEASALGVEHYAQMGLTIGLIASALLAMHRMYDVRRPAPWPKRFNAIVSAVSTAAVLSLLVSFYRGDAPFSRLWFGTGWAFALVLLLLWRTLAQRLLLSLRHVLTPTKRVLIVGANGLGEELAIELACHYEVVGYADNGSDLDRLGDFPLLGPIAQL